MPTFYTHPESVHDIIDHVAMRVLIQFGLDTLAAPGPSHSGSDRHLIT